MKQKQLQFIKQYELRKKDFLEILLICVGIYAVVLGIETGINLHLTEPVLAPFATIFTLFAFCILQFCNELMGFTTKFNVAVSMGQTRKSFVWSYELFSFLFVTVMGAGIYLLNKAEGILAEAVFGIPAAEIDLTEYFSALELMSMVVIFVSITVFLQAAVLHFGTKVLWILWAVLMVLCYLPEIVSKNPALHQKLENLFESLQHLFSFGSGFWSWFMGAGIVYAVILLLISWLILRRQRVTL